MRQTRDRDLRAGDVFHFFRPPSRRGIGSVWATHPPLEQRIAQLERMERAVQARRGA